MASSLHFLLLIVAQVAFLGIVAIAVPDHPSQFTQVEKNLIKELRQRVKGNLTQPIMNEDGYLLRFLRARNLDLDEAEFMMHENLAWRKEEKIDTIFEEDWSSWMKKFPFSFNMQDREGRPVVTCGIGQIDPRRLILAGKQKLMDRYLTYGFERCVYNVHQASLKTGFISGYVLFNMAGYSSRTHACLACIPSWIRLILNYERYYPRLAKELISINTPRIFQTLLDILKPYLSPVTAKLLVVFDHNKAEWKRELLKRFSEHVLTPEFGGKGPNIPAKSLHDQDITRIIYYNNQTVTQKSMRI